MGFSINSDAADEAANKNDETSTSDQNSPAKSNKSSIKEKTTKSVKKRSSNKTKKIIATKNTDLDKVATNSLDEKVDEPTKDEPQVLSVSDINKHIRNMLEGEFSLIWLQGEISNFKAHSSGHFYFSLKDKKAQINAVMFKGLNSRLKFKPADGQEVMVRGKITVYEPRGNYQIFCELMEPVGAGALQMAYEQLKAKLQNEGLFSEARKKTLPTLPKHIALVTSPTGAAVRDMLNVLSRRFKGVNITLIPALVQGVKATASIVEGIRRANLLGDVDVLIVGRGGGSIEDLWAFNEEPVARAIADSEVPVVSAVGHEVDFTIADFVADLRAPTPSAAAELVIQNAEDLAGRIQLQKKRLWSLYQSQFKSKKQSVENLSKRLVDPKRKLQDLIMRCDELSQRLEQAIFRNIEARRNKVTIVKQNLARPQDQIQKSRQHVDLLNSKLESKIKFYLEVKKQKLNKNTVLLDSLSPLKVVDRGFSIVTKAGAVIKNKEQISKGDRINIKFATGEAEAVIDKFL